ncbi:MAG: GNAT family N-acetyltransferase [Acidimicrobiales bacterium]
MSRSQATIGRTEPDLAGTVSGIRIGQLSAEAAEGFLAQAGVRIPLPIDAALGAFDDEETIIGVAAIGCRANAGASLTVAVAPAWRRRRVGSDLLRSIVAEAAARKINRVLLAYPESSVAAEALVHSSGLLAAQRRSGGEVTVLLLVSSGF